MARFVHATSAHSLLVLVKIIIFIFLRRKIAEKKKKKGKKTSNNNKKEPTTIIIQWVIISARMLLHIKYTHNLILKSWFSSINTTLKQFMEGFQV